MDTEHETLNIETLFLLLFIFFYFNFFQRKKKTVVAQSRHRPNRAIAHNALPEYQHNIMVLPPHVNTFLSL